MSKNNEIVNINENKGFLQLADFNMSDAISEELDGLDGGFERIKIPSAGSTVFEVPGEDPGEPDSVKEFSAVILYHHPIYAYYQSKYNGGSNPPDCGSFDGITGLGNKGKKSNAVVTSFSLKKAINSSGISFSQAQFAVDRNLTDEEYALINTLSDQVKAYSYQLGYDVEPVEAEYSVDPETGEIIEPLK